MTQPSPFSSETQVPQPSWFGRNWGKLLGCGCFGIIFSIGGIIALVFIAISLSLKASDPYAMALEKARKSSAVTSVLGEPLEPGFLARGSIRLTNSNGVADFIFPVSGPKGSAIIHVSGHKTSGNWTLDALVVIMDSDKKTINLLATTPE